MPYKKCGFREILQICKHPEDKCNKRDCDFHKSDFWNEDACKKELINLTVKVMKILPKYKRFKHRPVPEHMREEITKMKDLVFGAEAYKKAIEWHKSQKI